MSDQGIDPSLESELAAIAERAGCELVHAEWKGGVLRLFIDREGGVTLADCEAVSRQTSAQLDVADFGRGRYTLEVSSPGLDRQLHRPADYERFVGRLVRVTHLDAATSRRRTDVGRLAGRRGDAVEVVDERTGDRTIIPLKNISLARLVAEL
jgi:ribosome maturation factor RimP